MAKTKISEFSATAADNTDITNINIAEGCSPANVNNAIRSLMALLKDQQAGTSGDPFTVAGTLVSSGALDVTGSFKLDGTAGASGQVLLSAGGSSTPTWGNAFTWPAIGGEPIPLHSDIDFKAEIEECQRVPRRAAK